jgi:hypothetical protein
MERERQTRETRSTWKAVAITAAVVLGGFAAAGAYIEALLPERADRETPVAAQQPAVPDAGRYDARKHGASVSYQGVEYEVVGRPVTMTQDQLSAAVTTDEDVRLFYRNDLSSRNKVPATYPQSGRTGAAGEWNRDASEHQGGGGGAMPYPQDKGPLFVRVGENTYRLARPAQR